MSKETPQKLLAVFVLFHVTAITLMSIPPSDKYLDREHCHNSGKIQQKFEQWAQRLSTQEYAITPGQLQIEFWSAVAAYDSTLLKSKNLFYPYIRLTRSAQNWSMFSGPTLEPRKLKVEIKEGREWRCVYLSRSEEHRWRAEQFDFHRFRKLVQMAGTKERIGLYYRLVDWIERKVIDDFPSAKLVRISLVAYKSLPPGDVLAGREPEETIIVDNVKRLSVR